MTKRFVEVHRPNPTRVEICEVTDRHGYSRGYYHLGVRDPAGVEFVAVRNNAGQWGQEYGWFDETRNYCRQFIAPSSPAA